MISDLTGPLIGNARADFMANAWGVAPAIWIGGLVCLVGVLATGVALPRFWAYRSTAHPGPAWGAGVSATRHAPPCCGWLALVAAPG